MNAPARPHHHRTIPPIPYIASSRWAAEKPHSPAYTFVDHQTDPDGTRETLTWSDIDRRARTVAAAIREYAVPGDRVAILAPQGLDYLTGLLGSCYARTIAVPLFPPDLSGHRSRIDNALTDSSPACILTTAEHATGITDRPVIAIDQLARADTDLIPPRSTMRDDTDSPAPGTAVRGDIDSPRAAGREGAGWRLEMPGADEVAYLQYTSGATGRPAAVMVTHGNLVANIEQLITAFRFEPGRSMTISWLPLWHDMGLMLAFGVPILHGDQSVFIDPLAFLMRPARWLQLARSTLDVYTAGPNFAYDYCVRRITHKTALDLSQVKVFLNGAEPVRPTTIANFTQAFGVAPETHTPAYGLAEAVVFVTSAQVDAPPTIHTFNRESLSTGVLRLSQSNPIELVSVGRSAGQRVVIVDSAGQRCGPGVIGEVWLSGPNVAAGYWGDAERTAEVFGARLADGSGPWLRTGDLGALYDGELYLTGRLKDLVIVDGRNHYPEDIEATVEAAHSHIRAGRVAAFSVPGPETERLVLIIETAGNTGEDQRNGDAPDDLAGAVRAAVQRDHGLHVHRVQLVPPGTIQRTSSGKLARRATRDWFLLRN